MLRGLISLYFFWIADYPSITLKCYESGDMEWLATGNSVPDSWDPAGGIRYRPSPGAARTSQHAISYVQGRYHLNQRTEGSLQKVAEFFERAIVEDAQFSLAHSGLADAYSLLGHYGVLGPADVWGRAAASAAAAVMLDSHSAEAHTTLAHVT